MDASHQRSESAWFFLNRCQHRPNNVRLGHLFILRSISCPQSTPFLFSITGNYISQAPLLTGLANERPWAEAEVMKERSQGISPSLCLACLMLKLLAPLVAGSFDSKSCQMAYPTQSHCSNQKASAMVLDKGSWFGGTTILLCPSNPDGDSSFPGANLFPCLASQHFHSQHVQFCVLCLASFFSLDFD